MGELRKMLEPASVALIGATEKEGTIGRALLENLSRSDKRRLFCVNPEKGTVLGMQCHPSMTALPGPVDLAVIAVRAALVPDVLEQCGQAKAEGALIISTGFREAGEEGRALEERLVGIRRTFGIRVIGPGSFGLIRPEIGLHASFLRANPQPGKIAFIAQSGELGSAVLEWGSEAHVGFSMFVSFGSMIDVDFGDLIDFLGEDYGTRSLLLNMERIVDARKFMGAARRFAHAKPLIVMKPGRFPESADEVQGDDLVYDAAFKRVGVVRVAEAKDLFDAAQVLDATNLPAGARLAVCGNARTIAMMATDALLQQGGRPAEFSPATCEALTVILPPQWNGKNPIDLGSNADTDIYVKAIDVCLKDREVDGLLVICMALTMTLPVDLAREVARIARGTQKPVIVAWMGDHEMGQGMEILREHKVPAYPTPEEAVNAYLDMHRYRRSLDLLYETPADLPIDGMPPIRHLKMAVQKVLRDGGDALTPEQSERLLKGYGIPVGQPGPPDYQLYLTMTRDRDFGSVIRFGLGGLARDVFKDCAIGLPPLNQTLARRLIEESKANTVLSGRGDSKPVDFTSLEGILVAFSNLIVDFPEIRSIFIEPLVVSEGNIRVPGARILLGSAPAGRTGAYPHLVITPYPSRYVMPWRLRDGTEVLLRPIRPEDEPMGDELFHTLSEETVRERFFSVIKDITHEMMARFCDIDYEREIAMVAETGEGERRRIIGISRLIIESDLKAEFAVLVHDDYQGKGLGKKLIDVLIGVGQEKGLEEIYGITLSDNRRLLKLVKSMGFTTVLQPGGVTGLRLKL